MAAALGFVSGAAIAVVALLLVLNATIGNKNIDYRIKDVAPAGDQLFARSMGALLGAPLLEGNHVEALANGEQIFPAMLAAIRGARRSVTFETYIYWSGAIGQTFAEALMERARAGVAVHVLVDWWGGEDIEKRYRRQLEAAGVEMRIYNPPRISSIARLNNRTHRKLLIVDGRIGFTGGVGIADAWMGDASDPEHWRDMHYRVEGPVVAQLQGAFMDNWTTADGSVLHGEAYFPALSSAGGQTAQLFTSASGGGAESIQLMYLASIASARRSIRLSMAYFIPDELAVAELVAARRRGVRVQIIVPGEHIDWDVVRFASHALWGPLLGAGIEIYEYQPTMYHCKVLIVDETWTSVGSTNFDNRSFIINDEANLNVLDPGFARAQVAVFERDLENSQRVTLQEWERRPITDKLTGTLMSLVDSQL